MIWLWAVACAPAPVDRPPPGPGWSSAPALLAPLQEHSVVALDGIVYVVGGYDERVLIVDRFEAFDPVTRRWEARAPLPAPVHHANAAAVDGQIHVVGALGEGFEELPVVWTYDPATDSWTHRERLPTDRAVGASGVGVLNGRIHLVGGLQGVRSVDLHTAWDPATGAFETRAPMPTARDHLAAGVADGVLVAAGGRDGGLTDLTDAVERYDPDTDQWTAGAPIPTARAGVAAAVGPQGQLHVLGGEGNHSDADGVFAEHEAYDVAADTWVDLGAMRTPRHGNGAAWVGDQLWVPGGADVQAFAAVDTHEEWTP